MIHLKMMSASSAMTAACSLTWCSWGRLASLMGVVLLLQVTIPSNPVSPPPSTNRSLLSRPHIAWELRGGLLQWKEAEHGELRESASSWQHHSSSSRYLLAAAAATTTTAAAAAAPAAGNQSAAGSNVTGTVSKAVEAGVCFGVWEHVGFADSCQFVKHVDSCQLGTWVEYLQVYFCSPHQYHQVAVLLLLLWLASLFFMLGNTAADYFCPSLEEMSQLLHLPPTVAGVTLLPLGNGAPDVFASLAAFLGSGQGQVGLNSVIGAAAFVTSVVAGAVALAVAARGRAVRVDRPSFLRDLSFFIVTLLVLFLIVLAKQVHLWTAAAFLCIYPIYGITVASSACSLRFKPAAAAPLREPLLGREGEEGRVALAAADDEGDEMEDEDNEEREMLERGMVEGQGMVAMELSLEGGRQQSSLPQWMWTRDVDIFHVHPHLPWSYHVASEEGHAAHAEEEESHLQPLWGWNSDEEEESERLPWYHPHSLYNIFIKLPITLPRLLTIPTHQKDPWLKPLALLSMFLAPPFFALVLLGTDHGLLPLTAAAAIGLMLGTAALLTSSWEVQPLPMALLWVTSGFIMSILWFYLIANELVALLVSFGVIFQIDSAILGLTVLAWGNSVGDLMANLALACTGGRDRIQIAWSGCFAGPMFNTLVGIGLSLVCASWQSYPAVFHIPEDPTLPYTMLFLLLPLLFSILYLPAAGMRPNKILGTTLISIYALFMLLRVLHVLDLMPLPAWS